jgi:hypothetical protein
MPGWDDQDALIDAQQVLSRLQRAQEAERAEEGDQDTGGWDLFVEEDSDWIDQPSAMPTTESTADEGGVSMGADTQDDNATDDDAFASLFEEPEEESNGSVTAGAANVSMPVTALVAASAADLGREGWTGSTPKVALQQWVQKKYRTQVKYKVAAGIGSATVQIKGQRHVFEQPPQLCYQHNQDAHNAAAMVALFRLTASES